MEILYFPLFLVVVAVSVIWLFKSKAEDEGSRPKEKNQAFGGLTDEVRRRRRPSSDRLGSAARPRSGQASVKGDIWQTRRERAAKESFSESTSRQGVYHAGYIGPTSQTVSSRPGGELEDQAVSEAEHLSIDEYLSKQEKEEAEKAAKEEGFSMTAMKYEPADESQKEDEETRKKRAGFKP